MYWSMPHMVTCIQATFAVLVIPLLKTYQCRIKLLGPPPLWAKCRIKKLVKKPHGHLAENYRSRTSTGEIEDKSVMKGLYGRWPNAAICFLDPQHFLLIRHIPMRNFDA